MKRQSTGDEEIFHFLLASMKAEAKLRSHDVVGKFSMGGIKCTHLLASSSDGSPVSILVKKQISILISSKFSSNNNSTLYNLT